MRRIVEQLEADARVAAAWLAGSIGRGEDDAWSDLDLHVAVYDQHLPTFWSDIYTLYEGIGRTVLIQQEMASNAQAGGYFQLVIFDGPLEVDWNVGPLSLAGRTPLHVLLFMRKERTGGRAAEAVAGGGAGALSGTAGLPLGDGTDRGQVHRAQ